MIHQQKLSLDMFRSMLFFAQFLKSGQLTNSKGLQEPGTTRSTRVADGGLGGTDGSDGLHVGLGVAHRGDLQHRDQCALVKYSVRCHHLCVTLLTSTHSSL